MIINQLKCIYVILIAILNDYCISVKLQEIPHLINSLNAKN